MHRTTAHIINHTHWDREWFLTSVYTSRWIAGLIDRLEELVKQNPGFHFFLDGQTLVIEDLFQLHPDYQTKVEQLIRSGNLLVGPYYCQPDWRMTGGEALLRNLTYGRLDMQSAGEVTVIGWLVDTFGHISQAPQLHQLFGIDSVYIWRGAPKMEPYFHWQGADASTLFVINLFGGYRNLYGVTFTPEIAQTRLSAEVDKLAPYYPTADIPLFDGYDLEDNPEDPVRFYHNQPKIIPSGIEILEATPTSFSQQISQMSLNLPAISGELISGKYGAVFPGTLSSRTYLKRMARDCECLLYQVGEPLAALAHLKGRPYPAESFEAYGRGLLQNAVHDCICGVSIDQVHEKMEFSYRQIFDALLTDVKRSVEAILQDFAPGTYAICTNAYPVDGWWVAGGQLHRVKTDGVGVWKTGEELPVLESGRKVSEFSWKNEFYEASINADGSVQVGKAILGAFQVYEERGDAYSGETGEFLGMLSPVSPLTVEQESERHCVLRIDCSAEWDSGGVSAVLHLTFDPSPLIRWQVELEGHGVDYRVDMGFETGVKGEIQAGMPFDVTPRQPVDRDLLPRRLDSRLEAVLLGQRELIETRTFPFQDFVSITDGPKAAVVYAQGIHAYQADGQGRLALTLNRAVEWLTRPDLEHRVGDAGPFFYVPDARGERRVVYELAVFLSDATTPGEILANNAAFQNPPLIVEAQTAGAATGWVVFQEDLPLSSLQILKDRMQARVYNPTGSPHQLSHTYQQSDVFGDPAGEISSVPPKAIVTLFLDEPQAPVKVEPVSGRCQMLNPPAWHAGENLGLPDPAIIQQLHEKVIRLEGPLEAMEAKLARVDGPERYRLQHQVFVLRREMLEYRLSARLNEIKLSMQGKLTRAYLYEPDEEIAAIGKALNQLRIKRRIYDYVIQVVGKTPDERLEPVDDPPALEDKKNNLPS